MRRLIVNLLYDFASVCCHVGDWLSPSGDDIWRDRQWRKFDGDRARTHEGTPMLSWPPPDGPKPDDNLKPVHLDCRLD